MVKEPGYSLVAVLGLAVGLAAFLLLSGFARYSWSYNAQVPDAEHVYIIKHRFNVEAGRRWWDKAPMVLREAARATPGVTDATGYLGWFPLNIQVDGQLHKLRSLTVLPGFAEMMGLQAVKGDLTEALTRPDAFAMTESAAMRLFGTTDVVGRAFLLNSVETKGIARIAAILRDPPANTTIPFESLNGLNLTLVPPMFRDEALHGPAGLARASADSPASRRVGGRGERSAAEVHGPGGAAGSICRPRPWRRWAAPRSWTSSSCRCARRISIATSWWMRTRWAWIAATARWLPGSWRSRVLILVLAAINYVNLATIRVIRRQREIGMRKVLGFGNGRLAFQFLAESLLVSLLATVIGLALAVLALPLFAELANRDLAGMLSLANIAAALGVGVIVGLVVSIYPAWIAFRVRPAQVLAGRPDTESLPARRLRQALSVLQIAAAMGLASFTLAVAWQTRFAIDGSPGFDPAPLLVFEMNEGRKLGADDTTRGFLAELAQQPAVAGVAISADAIGRTRNPWSQEFKREGGRPITFEVREISPQFFEEYGIRPVAGRLFDPKIDKDDAADAGRAQRDGRARARVCIRAAGRGQRLAGQRIRSRRRWITMRVIGIAPDIRLRSLREAPTAVVVSPVVGRHDRDRARAWIRGRRRDRRANRVAEVFPADRARHAAREGHLRRQLRRRCQPREVADARDRRRHVHRRDRRLRARHRRRAAPDARDRAAQVVWRAPPRRRQAGGEGDRRRHPAGRRRGVAARGARHRAISRAVQRTHADGVLGAGCGGDRGAGSGGRGRCAAGADRHGHEAGSGVAELS